MILAPGDLPQARDEAHKNRFGRSHLEHLAFASNNWIL